MTLLSTLAAQSYAATRPATEAKPGAGGTLPGAEGAGAGFARIAESFTETLQASDAVAEKAMTGKADSHALVEALTQSELAVQTAVAVRDRVVEAYQEILRMPV